MRIFTWASLEPTLEVFDKTTGALLAQIELPANAQGALMTYMVRGRQYIVDPGRRSQPPRRAGRAQPALSRLVLSFPGTLHHDHID